MTRAEVQRIAGLIERKERLSRVILHLHTPSQSDQPISLRQKIAGHDCPIGLDLSAGELALFLERQVQAIETELKELGL